MLVCGGVGPPGYLFSDSRAHGDLVVLILALWAVALCLVRVGTIRLRHQDVFTVGVIDAPFRPVRPRAVRRRNSSPGSERFARVVFGVMVLAVVAASLHDQVNAVAYLTDSTSTAVFVPLSHTPDCGRHGCTTNTTGIIEPGGRPALWPGEIPLGNGIRVQAPVWPSGPVETLMTNDQALLDTVGGMIIDAAAVGVVSSLVLLVWRRLRRRRPGAVIQAAWAGRRPLPDEARLARPEARGSVRDDGF
jgi:hypothetical protein